MTSAPVHDPLADHLLTPENAALLLIDYQPPPLAGAAPRPRRTYEPGTDWYWCYVDHLVSELEGAPRAPSQP
jgi:hypothetical protein